MIVKIGICNANFPFIFAKHMFFLIENNEKIERYEFLWGNEVKNQKTGHVYMNYYKPEEGLLIFPYLSNIKSKATILTTFNSRESQKIYKALLSNLDYFGTKKYNIILFNSNTFVKCIVKKSKVDYNFPFNAFG